MHPTRPYFNITIEKLKHWTHGLSLQFSIQPWSSNLHLINLLFALQPTWVDLHWLLFVCVFTFLPQVQDNSRKEQSWLHIRDHSFFYGGEGHPKIFELKGRASQKLRGEGVMQVYVLVWGGHSRENCGVMQNFSEIIKKPPPAHENEWFLNIYGDKEV